MNISDDHVADLPLHHGRAELLEEIMSTPVLDDRPAPSRTPRRRTPWLVPVAAAAVVAALAVGSAWWASGDGPHGAGVHEPSQVATQPAPRPPAYGVILDAPGWLVRYASIESSGSELSYEKGDQSFDVSRYPADSYASYVEDRRHIVDPPADGEPVEVLGLGGQLWAYSPGDHTVIRERQDGSWLEFRGSGMDKAAFLALLGRLRAVDKVTFEAALPEDFVGSGEASAAIDEMLAGIEAEAGVVFPEGSDVSVSSDEVDPYQLGADVSGTVACAWLEEFAVARQAGDTERAQRAVDVLATSRTWPVLLTMDKTGEYPDVIWQYADEVAAGRVPEGYTDGLGCADRS
jgi:hypothetical protein